MGVADERNVLDADNSNDQHNILRTARRRRRIRSMETQFRFLCALVGKRPEVETRVPEVVAPDSDLRAALWLLRRSRKQA